MNDIQHKGTSSLEGHRESLAKILAAIERSQSTIEKLEIAERQHYGQVIAELTRLDRKAAAIGPVAEVIARPNSLAIESGTIVPTASASNILGNRDLPKRKGILIFLHIPKTGGHSFEQAIIKKYGLARIGFIQNPDEFEALQISNRPGQFSCLHGHMPYGAVHYLDEPCTHYVVLRDPVDRFISDYFHIYNTPQHSEYKKIHEKNISLLDYAQVPCPIHFVCHNAQVRRCASYDFTFKDRAGNFWWHRRKEADEAMLEEAKYNLEHRIRTFGLFEKFDASFRAFCKLIDVDMPITPKVNVARSRAAVSAVDPVTLEAIKEANRLDIDLYEFAQKLWTKQFG